MPGFASLEMIGAQPIGSVFIPDTIARAQTGLIVSGQNGWWGGGEFVYGKAGGTIRAFGVVVDIPAFSSTAGTDSNPYTPGWEHIMTECPSTTIMGRPIYIAMAAMTTGQFGWFQRTGTVPVNCNASVAADTTFAVAATGQGGALAAGKQVVNGRIITAATLTVVKVATANNGSLFLTVSNSDGWFPGIYLSGTGIQATTTVTALSPDGRTATISLATSAVVNGNVTGTYNNATVFYNVAAINAPFSQGAIT